MLFQFARWRKRRRVSFLDKARDTMLTCVYAGPLPGQPVRVQLLNGSRLPWRRLKDKVDENREIPADVAFNTPPRFNTFTFRRNHPPFSEMEDSSPSPPPSPEMVPSSDSGPDTSSIQALVEMAQRQQQQISAQQQLLTAKESRLKYLRQQETRVANSAAADAERLRHLRERVEAQELKLRKLRALRGQVDQQKINNNGLTSDLDSIRALFNEKEKELNLAVARVEELTRQLDEMRLRRQSRNNQQLLPAQSNQLEALRRELLYRNRLTEAQAVRVSQQQEVLSAKHKEMARIDTRIAELQQRLHRKRMLNQQLARQISSSKINQASKNVVNARARMANVAAVEPFQHIPHQPQEEKESPEFHPTKGDACGKYQTLPANTKLLSAEEGEKGEEGSSSVTTATSVSNGIYSSAAAGAGGQRTPGSTSNNRPQVLPMTARPIRPVPPPKPQSPQTPQQMVQVPRLNELHSCRLRLSLFSAKPLVFFELTASPVCPQGMMNGRFDPHIIPPT
ncbi:unnamed protein product [Cyprideis torosa]|uniref:Uncharacterized protein n=1 Tax=Cyprideis torosa TaxID=163714 RepID=A0A7R8ZJW4_9CRUS|nr:unnamed protein product [Cyprideis torosa]CAG0880482.1 unnamed protein product [Cyprideis torosa]